MSERYTTRPRYTNAVETPIQSIAVDNRTQHSAEPTMDFDSDTEASTSFVAKPDAPQASQGRVSSQDALAHPGAEQEHTAVEHSNNRNPELNAQRATLYALVDEMKTDHSWENAFIYNRLIHRMGHPKVTIRDKKPYRIDKFLGRGGFSRTLTVSQETGRMDRAQFVMKVSKPFSLAAMNGSDRQAASHAKNALLEIEALRRLSTLGTENPAPALEAAQLIPDPDNMDSRIATIVMEKIHGETLHDFLAESLSLDTGIAIIQKMIHAISVIHEAGIIHGDLKMENIMVYDENPANTPNAEAIDTPHYQVKIIDFGGCTITDEPDSRKAQQRLLHNIPLPTYRKRELYQYTRDFGLPRKTDVAALRDEYSLGHVIHTYFTGLWRRIAIGEYPNTISQQVDTIVHGLTSTDEATHITILEAEQKMAAVHAAILKYQNKAD